MAQRQGLAGFGVAPQPAPIPPLMRPPAAEPDYPVFAGFPSLAGTGGHAAAARAAAAQAAQATAVQAAQATAVQAAQATAVQVAQAAAVQAAQAAAAQLPAASAAAAAQPAAASGPAAAADSPPGPGTEKNGPPAASVPPDKTGSEQGKAASGGPAPEAAAPAAGQKADGAAPAPKAGTADASAKTEGSERAGGAAGVADEEEGEGGAVPGEGVEKAELDRLKRQNSTVPEPSDVDYDPPLIQCLAGLFKLHGKPVSTRLLTAGLPKTSGSLHPSAAIRAAQAAGMRAKTVYRPTVAQISPLTLPCILLLQGEKACILAALNGDEAEVLFPENGLEPRTVPRQELESEYMGYAIYAKPEPKLDRRASDIKLLKHKRWFWGTLFYFLPIYKHVFGASILVNLLAVCGPLFFMNVYDRVVPNHALDTLWMLAIGIGIAYLFDFLLRNLRSYFVDVAGRNADIVLASRLMQHLLAMRLDVKPDSTGSLANNLREFESLRDFFGSTTLMALVDLPFLVFFIVLIFLIGGPMGVIPLVAVPIVICAGLFLQFPLQQVTEKGFKENMQKNALLVEIINGLETIKTTMAEGRIQHAWERVVGMSAASNNQTKRMSNLSVTMTIVITQLVSVFIIVWGVYRISEGLLSMGELIACNMMAGRAMAPLSQVASMLTRLQNSRMALKSLDALMSLETEKPEAGEYVEFGHLEHSLTLEELCFKYPATERFALEKVNMHIKPGEKVGIIGRMGSGKSTLGRMCVGLYQPTEGAVKLGGVDIRQLDMVDLRSRIGYVSQDNYLFYGTVRENISFGALNADDRMILRAANIAGVTDFVRAHPAGFGMPVGERGMSLSGGQRQSVAIARALLQDPDIIILDEPSSNMDNSSELALKQRLGATLGNKTLILVTHRLSMLDLVERLVVMDNGRIVADGPKNAVLNALRSEQMRISGAGGAPHPAQAPRPAGPPQQAAPRPAGAPQQMTVGAATAMAQAKAGNA
ncbi:type I secretion system permease/ATPase [Desulfovibrio sp. OttesenSCG-928-A18]|nr:type I secretion system permease/ATPase [Desulfovibrio sp. OttesenSCG-928-A18]